MQLCNPWIGIDWSTVLPLYLKAVESLVPNQLFGLADKDET